MCAKSSKPETAIVSRADLRAGVASTEINPLFAGFQDASGFELPAGAIVKSMSPMIKPINFPVGKVLVGKFVKMFETNPTKKKKGVGIEIIPDGANTGLAIPVVATIAQGLEIDDVALGDKAKSPHLGKRVAIQRFEAKLPSKKGQDAWHFVVAILPDEPASKK